MADLELDKLPLEDKISRDELSALRLAVSRSNKSLSLSQIVAVGRVYLKPTPSPTVFNQFAQAVAGQAQPSTSPSPSQPVNIKMTTDNESQSKPASAPKPQKRKRTEQQEKFFSVLEAVAPQDAVDRLRDQVVSKKTADQYKSSIPLYEASCDRAEIAPWPVSYRAMEVFGGYLVMSEAYKRPAQHLHAVMHTSKMKTGKKPTFDIDDVVAAVERDVADAEQSEPISLDVLRRLGSKVQTHTDFCTWVTAAGAFFCLARADSFIKVRAPNIVIKDNISKRATVTLRNIEGCS